MIDLDGFPLGDAQLGQDALFGHAKDASFLDRTTRGPLPKRDLPIPKDFSIVAGTELEFVKNIFANRDEFVVLINVGEHIGAIEFVDFLTDYMTSVITPLSPEDARKTMNVWDGVTPERLAQAIADAIAMNEELYEKRNPKPKPAAAGATDAGAGAAAAAA